MCTKKTTISKLWRCLFHLSIIIFGVISIISSGGGGDGDDDNDNNGNSTGISYTGPTTQLLITEDNAIDISYAAFHGAEKGSTLNLGAVSSEVSISNRGFSIIQVSRLLTDIICEADVISYYNRTFTGAVQTESGTIDGDCGGDISYSISVDDQTGEFSGSFNYNGYCSSGNTITGQANVEGTINIETEEFETMTLTFSELSIIAGDESMTMDGDISIEIEYSQITMTMEMLLKDNSSGDIYWINNYVLVMEASYNYVCVDLEGRFYDPNYGYVDLTTENSFYIYDDEQYPSEGSLIVTGENNTKAKLTSLSSETFQVQADTDGDGVYDYNSGVLNWSDY